MGWSASFYATWKGQQFPNKSKSSTGAFADQAGGRHRVFFLRWVASLQKGAPNIPTERLNTLDAAIEPWLRTHPEEKPPSTFKVKGGGLDDRNLRATLAKNPQPRHVLKGTSVAGYLQSSSRMLQRLYGGDGNDFTEWMRVAAEPDMEERVSDAIHREPDHLRCPTASNCAMVAGLGLYPLSETTKSLITLNRVLFTLKAWTQPAWDTYLSTKDLRGKMKQTYVPWRALTT